MPQGDKQSGAVEEALKHGEDAVVALLESTEVLQPGVGTLDFPAFAVSAELAFVLKASPEGAAAVFGEDKAEQQAKVDVTRMQAKIGELTLENDFLETALIKAGLLNAKR